MSVLIVGKVRGDTAIFTRALTDRAAEFVNHGEMASAAGAIHHRFGIGDGLVMFVDEWETVEQFEKFFGNPDLQAFIGEIGADMTAAPDITVTQAISSPDER